MKQEEHVVIVGGGISGLATAYYLEQKSDNIRCTVLEAAPILGGKIATKRDNDFITEGGPESFVTRKREAWELCQELGLGDRLVGTTSRGKNYILHNGRPSLVPMGLGDAIRTPLLSFKGKMRVLREPFTPPRTDPADETMGDFLRRRVGAEMVDNVVAPAMGSVYLSDVNKMSVQVIFGQFADMEREHGSLVKGMFALMKQRRAERKLAEQNGQPIKKEKLPAFATLRGGLMELIETLAAKIDGAVMTGAKVTAVAYNSTQSQPFQLTLADGRTLCGDKVVLATPAFAMADLLASVQKSDFSKKSDFLAEKLRAVHYNPVTIAVVSFNKSDIPEPFDGFGVVVPATERSRVLAIEAVSNKFPHRSPDNQAVMRVFVGGFRHGELSNLPDDALMTLVRAELDDIFGIKAAPTSQRIFRWQPANPQYAVGHLDMVDEADGWLQANLPGVYLTGSGMRGMGVPDCIRQAKEVAEKIIMSCE
ncbi:MAG: protoporphyrinogen oxidase [Chloroflexi bacterium]|nr:protoporphyrinogen oxidase [Chloroflexota bacterium]